MGALDPPDPERVPDGGVEPDDRVDPDPDMVFRSLAAPGMEEDDIFAALLGLPGKGAFWGDDHPSPYRPSGDEEWSEEAERRRRHEEILRRWDPDAT
ncbi:MAG: hypothetical protein FJW99_01775 [Actinobacteria bacterium]|nr:hypothetical protein [Actinomycetota bacterium]MBM3697979.1 hypothetical protein [Actinomycetota bacterium]